MKRLHPDDPVLMKLSKDYQNLVDQNKSLIDKNKALALVKVGGSLVGISPGTSDTIIGIGTAVVATLIKLLMGEKQGRKNDRITFGQADPAEAKKFTDI